MHEPGQKLRGPREGGGLAIKVDFELPFPLAWDHVWLQSMHHRRRNLHFIPWLQPLKKNPWWTIPWSEFAFFFFSLAKPEIPELKTGNLSTWMIQFIFIWMRSTEWRKDFRSGTESISGIHFRQFTGGTRHLLNNLKSRTNFKWKYMLRLKLMLGPLGRVRFHPYLESKLKQN